MVTYCIKELNKFSEVVPPECSSNLLKKRTAGHLMHHVVMIKQEICIVVREIVAKKQTVIWQDVNFAIIYMPY